MIYQILALVILAAFYAIYLGKMIAQKRKGIQTDQIAKGKEKDKQYYKELVLKLVTYSIVLVEAVCIFMDWSLLPDYIRVVGVIFGVAGVVIFGTAVWTMRDSWRAGIAKEDKREMITSGIYRFSRNPAFVGFDLVYIGVLLLFFNPLLFVFSLFAMLMLHLQILQEEAFLPTVFGEEYKAYCSKVCRYLGCKKDR